METTEEESTGQPWQVVLAPVPATGREAKAEGQESRRPARTVAGTRQLQWRPLLSCAEGAAGCLHHSGVVLKAAADAAKLGGRTGSGAASPGPS